MKNHILSVIVLAILVLSCTEYKKAAQSNGQQSNNYQVDIDNFLNELDKENSFMGSVAILKDGEDVYAKTIGMRDVAKGIISDRNTKFRIASISKSFTAVLVFKTIEANKITLDQTIESFFPELPKANEITVRHLLHHQSGIKSYTKDQFFWDNRTKNQDAKILLKAIVNMDRNFGPGESTGYSNSNYFLLAEILEEVNKKSYADLLEEQVIKPLELNNTLIGTTIESDNYESYSYTFENDKWELLPATHLSLAKGSGSLISTPQDLNTFFRSLFTGELVSQESLDHMKTIVRNHGMGTFAYDIFGQKGFGHGGNIDACNAASIYFKEKDLAISITSNGATIPINEVYSKVLELFLGEVNTEISEEELDIYAGEYISENDPSDKSVFEREGNVLIHMVMGEFREPLIYKGNGRFIFNQMSAQSIYFSFSEDGRELIFEQGNYKEKYLRDNSK